MSLHDNKYATSYSSYGGVDMIVTFAGVQVGESQGISYSVSREKGPVYTMGQVDPRGFTRGKRGISGSIVFIIFDRSVLVSRLKNGEASSFMASKTAAAIYNDEQSLASASNIAGIELPGNVTSPSQLDKDYIAAWYADQIPPFDIVIQAANEYGHTARMVIRGVEVLNTGSGMSIDDMQTDESHTFVARAIKPWHLQKRFDGTGYKDTTYMDR